LVFPETQAKSSPSTANPTANLEINMQPIEFFAHTDIVIIGTNPEAADYTNPRGNIFGHSAHVVAEDKNGNRCRLHVATSRFEDDVLPQAERLAAALNARLALGKLPVGFGSWSADRPAYGSAAYEAYGAFDDLMVERREAEDEWLA
jgi:hypothetical protein